MWSEVNRRPKNWVLNILSSWTGYAQLAALTCPLFWTIRSCYLSLSNFYCYMKSNRRSPSLLYSCGDLFAGKVTPSLQIHSPQKSKWTENYPDHSIPANCPTVLDQVVLDYREQAVVTKISKSTAIAEIFACITSVLYTVCRLWLFVHQGRCHKH